MYLIVLNYNSGEIDIYKISTEFNSNLENFLVSLGYKLSEISWMCTDNLLINKFYK